ncbi:hypothetical protein L1887_20671 [Cichorium endivia]|nr:hypothetical protein L1887_20671 [Cichorium endivia]
MISHEIRSQVHPIGTPWTRLQLTTMSLFNKMGNILKQTVSKHGNHEMLATNPSIFQMIRSMSSSKLFVGGLSYATDEMSLRDAFSAYGDVQEGVAHEDILGLLWIVKLVGQGVLALLLFSDIEAASAAIQALDQRVVLVAVMALSMVAIVIVVVALRQKESITSAVVIVAGEMHRIGVSVEFLPPGAYRSGGLIATVLSMFQWTLWNYLMSYVMKEGDSIELLASRFAVDSLELPDELCDEGRG